jgi:type II secretion system protein H
MTPRHRRRDAPQAGFSLPEILVVLVIIGIMALISVPFFLTYYQSARLKAAAEEMAAFLNQGRQLAIRENQNVCVQVGATQLQYRLGGCAGAAWVGAGTDGAGNITIPGGITFAATANPVFSYLGAAAPAASYTLTNPETGRTLTVAVAASGRVSIAP